MIEVLNLIGNTKYEGDVVSITDGWVVLKNNKVTFVFNASNPAVKIIKIDAQWKKHL